jgi:hypothetical protein
MPRIDFAMQIINKSKTSDMFRNCHDTVYIKTVIHKQQYYKIVQEMSTDDIAGNVN